MACLAPDHAGDERAVPGIRVDVVGVDRLLVAGDTGEERGERVGCGRRVPAGVHDRYEHPLAVVGPEVGRRDDDVSARLLRLRRRATAGRGHPDHLVGRGDTHAEHAVKPVEHHEHVVVAAELEACDAVDEPVGDPPADHRVVVTRLVELLGHTRQVVVADQDVLTAVEVGEVGNVVRRTRRHRDVVEGLDDDLDLASDPLATTSLVRVARLPMRAGHGDLPPVSASMPEMSLAYPQSESVRGRMDVTELERPDLSTPPEELPALALSRPRIALDLARSHAVPGADPWTLSFALQAAGIVLRDAGETTAAIAELRQAVRAAEATGAAARVADVRATLGAALVKAGRTQAGLGQL